MTSTRVVACILAAATLAGPAAAQRINAQERLVALEARLGKEHQGYVVLDGESLVAVRPIKKRRARYPRNFRESADWMMLDNQNMGRDPEGEDKAVRAVKEYGEHTKWKKVGGGFRVQLRAPSGPFKGWYVGLGPPEKVKGGKEVRRKLILVKDKKDAATFEWEDPDDEGR